MRVQSILTERSKLSVVSTKDSLKSALDKMKNANIKSIPVIDENKFMGIVFKDKILEVSLESENVEAALSDKRVESLVEAVPIMDEESSFESIVNTLREKDVVFIAINNHQGDFLGIVPHKAIFDELREMLGFSNGKKITIYLFDVPGQLAKISRIFAKHNANIQNLVVRNPKSKFQLKEIILRVDESISETIKEELEDLGYRVEL